MNIQTVLDFNYNFRKGESFDQCWGSWSVGSARFWLPGSVSVDPHIFAGKISTKNCKKTFFLLLNPKSEILEKKIDYQNCLISVWFVKFKDKNCEKNNKNLKIIFCSKDSVNLIEMTWIRIRIKIKWILSTALDPTYPILLTPSLTVFGDISIKLIYFFIFSFGCYVMRWM